MLSRERKATMAGERGYLAYLVRLWAVHDDGEFVWRASAEDAHTGERRVFADVAGLCRFLHSAIIAAPVLEPSEIASRDAPHDT
jgi:hypothetical protein